MRKLKMAIVGFGQRGGIYGEYSKANSEKIEVSAVVESAEDRRLRAKAMFPEAQVYSRLEEFVQLAPAADFVAVCTQDKQHKEHAVTLMKAGYDLLLEKPIANTKEDCIEIYEASKKYNKKVIVCHVLRYTPFYRKVKEIVESGKLGNIINVHAGENVGFYHFAHSFVRGPWRNSKESSPVILAKCCHDMDILRYLIGKKCLSVSSVGNLKYFKKENAPRVETKYCSDCPEKNCTYKAQTLYIHPQYRWTANYFSLWSDDEETVLRTLKKTQYDRCVYDCDNDVCDHQETLIRFEGGVAASLSLTAFSAKNYRDIKIHGTQAELYGNTEINEIMVSYFSGKEEKYPIDLPDEVTGGHLGGDYYLMESLYKFFNGEEVKELSLLDVSLESHLMSFAAEESRKAFGKTVDIK